MNLSIRVSIVLSTCFAALFALRCSAAQSAADIARQALEPRSIELVEWEKARHPLGQIRASCDRIESVLYLDHKEELPLVASIRANTEFLRERASIGKNNPVPKAYAESLQLDAEQLISFQIEWNEKRLTDPRKIHEILQDISDDLETKASHCKQSIRGWASLITVAINTLKKDGDTVQGLEVWYVPKGWAETEDRWTRCSKLSSPAKTEKVPPGKYVIRISKGEPVPVKIGGDGKNEQSIDLLVR
jgi:hypothetical protein